MITLKPQGEFFEVKKSKRRTTGTSRRASLVRRHSSAEVQAAIQACQPLKPVGNREDP